jgi:DNA-binding response OmpR family regulator
MLTEPSKSRCGGGAMRVSLQRKSTGGRAVMVSTERPAGRILLVEDDDSLGSILAAVLQDQGYQVALAGNGKEALDYLAEDGLPDLILLNLVMPAMNGWKFREQLRKLPELAAIPVIVLSGVDHVERKAAALGAADSFEKPYNLKALVDRVRERLPPGRMSVNDHQMTGS